MFFMAGVLLEMAISGSILWGEIETRIYTSQSSGLGLTVNCPLVISFNETATVSTLITNSLDEEVQPVISTNISQNGGPQEFNETLILAPHESKKMTWKVAASNADI